jgi:hypothetical protein
MLEQKSQADVAKQLNNPVADLWAVNFTAEVDCMVVHPEDFGQHWGVRFQIIPVLPALFKDTLF